MSSKLAAKTVDALLDKLSSDDDFRARFQQNPREATRSLGIDDEAIDTLPETPMRTLANKKLIAASRDVLRKQLADAPYPFIPHCLDVPER